jgi:ring-1,2-phenylacetyl-CoA epoxidase subunit PaaD
MTAATLDSAVQEALATVCDPEYPGVSVVELGLVEHVKVLDGHVRVGMIPTYGGCPALGFIADDVRDAVSEVDGVDSCEVTWLRTPVWTVDRVSATAARQLEREFTVTLRRADGTLRCPVCGSDAAADTALMGPTRCRSLAYCAACRNPIEVMR